MNNYCLVFYSGNEAQEVDDNPAPKDLKNWNWDKYKEYIKEKLEPIKENVTSQILKHYPYGDPKQFGTKDPEYQLTSMISDVRARCPTDEVLKKASKTLTSPIYRYITNAQPDEAVIKAFLQYHAFKFHPRYAFRRYSMYGFFGFPKIYLKKYPKNFNHFVNKIRRMVTTFVESGNPNLGLQIHDWSPFPNRTLTISNPFMQTQSKEHYNPERCQLWEEQGFFPKYAWHA